MYKHIGLSAASLLAVTFALCAQAQPFAGRGPVPFAAMDLDGDGYVSSREFSQHHDARMAARAAQGRLLHNADRAPRFENWDTDGDGLLNAAEVTSGQQTRFAARRSGGRPYWRNR